MNNVVTIKNIDKVYPLYASRKDRLKELLLPWRQYHQKHLALKNITFDILQGEHLGIIGKNGSGKSTLLKIISGVLTPTSGSAKTSGTVGALLELGAGYNHQMTGRENINFMFSLSGLPESLKDATIERIISFADIGNYIDQPVKNYSSGMFVRLAFSQSIMTSPDILIVDEALSVGDVFFQQKCIRLMEEYRKNGTIIFVSHDMAMMSKICSKVIWLERGQIREIGNPKSVCDRYLGEIYSGDISNRSSEEFFFKQSTSYFENHESIGTGDGKILNASLTSKTNAKQFVGGEEVELHVNFESYLSLTSATIGFIVRNRLGSNIFGTNTEDEGIKIQPHANHKYLVKFKFKMPYLQTGDYTISLAFAEGTCEKFNQIHYIFDALNFNISKTKEREVIFYQPMIFTELLS